MQRLRLPISKPNYKKNDTFLALRNIQKIAPLRLRARMARFIMLCQDLVHKTNMRRVRLMKPREGLPCDMDTRTES